MRPYLLKNLRLVFILSIICTLYYSLSIWLSKNNQFIQYRLKRSSSIIESKNEGVFIGEINLNDCNSENNKIKIENNFEIWFEKSVMLKSYGIIPFEHLVELGGEITLRVEERLINSDIVFSVNDSERYLSSVRSSFRLKKNVDVKIEFFQNEQLIYDCIFQVN